MLNWFNCLFSDMCFHWPSPDIFSHTQRYNRYEVLFDPRDNVIHALHLRWWRGDPILTGIWHSIHESMSLLWLSVFHGLGVRIFWFDWIFLSHAHVSSTYMHLFLRVSFVECMSCEFWSQNLVLIETWVVLYFDIEVMFMLAKFHTLRLGMSC